MNAPSFFVTTLAAFLAVLTLGACVAGWASSAWAQYAWALWAEQRRSTRDNPNQQTSVEQVNAYTTLQECAPSIGRGSALGASDALPCHRRSEGRGYLHYVAVPARHRGPARAEGERAMMDDSSPQNTRGVSVCSLPDQRPRTTSPTRFIPLGPRYRGFVSVGRYEERRFSCFASLGVVGGPGKARQVGPTSSVHSNLFASEALFSAVGAHVA